MVTKQNCWESLNCGRQTGGAKVGELGVCPAASTVDYNGMNHGVNAGRLCWAVAGTYCEGEVQGSFGKKFDSCKKCSFFQMVKDEEKLTDAQILRQYYQR